MDLSWPLTCHQMMRGVTLNMMALVSLALGLGFVFLSRQDYMKRPHPLSQNHNRYSAIIAAIACVLFGLGSMAAYSKISAHEFGGGISWNYVSLLLLCSLVLIALSNALKRL
jgi:hypothetical protein